MEIVTPNIDDIDSWFEQKDDALYKGGHVCDDLDVSVDRRYYHDKEAAMLHVETIYYVDGHEVNVTNGQWRTNTDTYRVEHSGEFIVDFCRNHHHVDPQLDVEFAQRHR